MPGAKLGVCTNKPQDLTDLLLAQLDLARHFGAVYGGGRASHNKPDPHHVLELVRRAERHARARGDGRGIRPWT